MKIFKNFFPLLFLLLIAYSCEPEELPENTIENVENISANTGDQGQEVEDRKGN